VKQLFEKIDDLFERQLPGWCTKEKAYTLASLVIGTRPAVIVEVGVFGGRSFLPMALALKELGKGMAIGIDPWSPAASVGRAH
jgi:predicted O-methyltransferase YrrM